MTPDPNDTTIEVEDVCALGLVRRVAALLDHDPATLREGDRLPAGWHVALFTGATRQSQLRPDGVADLGFTLPSDPRFPRLMLGGRRVTFAGHITLGSTVRRRSRITAIVPKEGRSGPFLIATVTHQIFGNGAEEPVLVEQQDYILREAASETAAIPPEAVERRRATIQREIVPDETMLFRYCAITFNTHRIHYDHPYATGTERYPALVVNGGLPILLLMELFRERAGRNPNHMTSRNLGSLYCGRPMRLCAEPADDLWRLWAEDDLGRPAVEMTIR